MGLERRGLIVALGACLAALICAPSAGASTIHVTNDNSSGPGSLQNAISQVNAGPGPSDRILIDDLGPNAVIRLRSNPVIFNAMTINGPKAHRVTIHFAQYGFEASRDLTLRRLDLTGASGDPGPLPSNDQRPLVASSNALTLDHVLVRGNHAKLTRTTEGDDLFDDSGLFNVNGPFEMTKSRVVNNSVDLKVTGQSQDGVFLLGGILEGSRDHFLMRRSEISHNQVTLRTPDADGNLRPSLLDIFDPAEIVDSSISGNVSTVHADGMARVSSVIFSAHSSITNSTIADNLGKASGVDSSVEPMLDPVFGLSISHSTITGNQGSDVSNLAASTAPTTISNSIIANPRGGRSCTKGGNFVSLGYNLGSDGSCGFNKPTDHPDVDPLLRPLGDYGGPTETVPVSPNSSAVDSGRSNSLFTDQRGQDRTFDTSLSNAPGSDGTDIGAFELRSVPKCAGRKPTIAAHPGEVTRGTSGNDVILGSRDKDRIESGPGDDLICGRSGGDRIRSGKGQDLVRGNRGSDTVLSGSSDDKLLGGAGFDGLSAGSGDDDLRGGASADLLEGNRGNDYLGGGKGRDLCFGGPGKNRRNSCKLPAPSEPLPGESGG